MRFGYAPDNQDELGRAILTLGDATVFCAAKGMRVPTEDEAFGITYRSVPQFGLTLGSRTPWDQGFATLTTTRFAEARFGDPQLVGIPQATYTKVHAVMPTTSPATDSGENGSVLCVK